MCCQANGLTTVLAREMRIGPGQCSDSICERVNQRDRTEARRRMVGGPFLLNMHPRPIFETNPYKSDKPLPPSKIRKEKPPLNTTPFKPTSPSKKPGNCKDGTFTKYPPHPVDGYGVKGKKPIGPKYGMFAPPTVPKSRPTDSLSIGLTLFLFLQIQTVVRALTRSPLSLPPVCYSSALYKATMLFNPFNFAWIIFRNEIIKLILFFSGKSHLGGSREPTESGNTGP
eukprot:sb/3469592/